MELTALSSRSGRAIATFLIFYASHDSTARFLRGAKILFFWGIFDDIFDDDVFLCTSTIISYSIDVF